MDAGRSCPRCGANLRVERRGDLHDKILVCGHCEFEQDVPDEVTIETEEDGRRVRIHRRDLPAGDGNAPALAPATRALFDDFQQKGVAGFDDGPRPRHLGGKRVTTTTTEQQVWTGDAATQKLAEMGIDLADLVPDAGATPTRPDHVSSTVEQQTFTGEAASKKLAEMGIDPDTLPWSSDAPSTQPRPGAPSAPPERRPVWPWILAGALVCGLLCVVLLLATALYLQA